MVCDFKNLTYGEPLLEKLVKFEEPYRDSWCMECTGNLFKHEMGVGFPPTSSPKGYLKITFSLINSIHHKVVLILLLYCTN